MTFRQDEDRETRLTLLDQFACHAMEALIRIGAERVRTEKDINGRDFSWPDAPYYFGRDPLGEHSPKDEAYSPLAMHAYDIASAMMSIRRKWLDDGTFDEDLMDQ